MWCFLDNSWSLWPCIVVCLKKYVPFPGFTNWFWQQNSSPVSSPRDSRWLSGGGHERTCFWSHWDGAGSLWNGARALVYGAKPGIHLWAWFLGPQRPTRYWGFFLEWAWQTGYKGAGPTLEWVKNLTLLNSSRGWGCGDQPGGQSWIGGCRSQPVAWGLSEYPEG